MNNEIYEQILTNNDPEYVANNIIKIINDEINMQAPIIKI